LEGGGLLEGACVEDGGGELGVTWLCRRCSTMVVLETASTVVTNVAAASVLVAPGAGGVMRGSQAPLVSIVVPSCSTTVGSPLR
jgi:hypothetical protein